MPAYIIADIEVIDSDGYEEYRQKVPAIIAAYGGCYFARGGATQALEGTWLPKRCVILEFPSMEKLKTFYTSPEYQPLLEIRQRTTKSNLIATEGL
jgi:uncharacterized protein (DUF1330 family)